MDSIRGYRFIGGEGKGFMKKVREDRRREAEERQAQPMESDGKGRKRRVGRVHS